MRCASHRGLPRIPDETAGPMWIRGYNDRNLADPAQRRPDSARVPTPSTPLAPIRITVSTGDPAVETAVAQTRAVIRAGALRQVEAQARLYVDHDLWHAIKIHNRLGRCRNLAVIAREILKGRGEPHSWLGRFAAAPFSGLERDLAVQLTARLPLKTGEADTIAAARGLQLTGMYICSTRDVGPRACQCFVDVARTDGPRALKHLIRAGATDWSLLTGLILGLGGQRRCLAGTAAM